MQHRFRLDICLFVVGFAIGAAMLAMPAGAPVMAAAPTPAPAR